MTKSAKAYNDVPVEKVYLHFDKPYYAVGDTIWFKAYLTYNIHEPSPISKIVYVDMIAPHDSLAQAAKLQVKNGVAWGSFILSQYSYKKGNYRVVAYTNYMNNNGFVYFFNKNITIGDKVNNQVSAQIALKSSVVNKFTKISAGIYYKDDDGTPYHDKKVSWEIQKDDESIAKGKGTTDKNGFIDISFTNLKNIKMEGANLVTEVETGDHKMAANTYSLKTVTMPNDVQFFPEGGQLITGVRSKIAFKAIRPNGLGIDIKGTITDNNNNVVTDFSSSHLGMGVFVLTPEDGKTYTAHVTYADGTSAAPEFPKVGSDGIDLSLDNNDPNVLNLKLLCDDAFLKDFKDKTFFILGKSGGAICFAAKMVLKDLLYSAPIPKSKFPTGIAQLTLFTDDGEPVSERVAFIQHNDQMNLAVNSDHPDYATRQMVKLNITAKNAEQPAVGNFSVAVIDESKVPFDENAETTILTNLLLTSDIKGYIEQPNYYFNHPDQKAVADLDILLLTQGYRRFSYDDILNNKMPVLKYYPEESISISGTLRGNNGIPVNHGNVHISIPDKNFFSNTVTDADGRFRFANLVFPDSAKVVVSARDNPRASELSLTLDGEHAQSIPINYNEPDQITNIDSVLSAYLTNSKIQYSNLHMLKEVIVKDTKIVKTVSHKDFGNLATLPDQPDHLIKADQFSGCNNILDCLKGLAAGMIFDNENFYVFQDYSQGKRIPVQIFVKGTPVDINYLMTLNVADVESVEIFLKDQLGIVNSTYNTNGAIVINMRKLETTKISYQDLKQILGNHYEVTLYPRGYQPLKTFYLPRYTGPRINQPAQIDLRSTIYWNPNVTTDKTGNATLQYYNADGTGTYRVTIEGIDKDGNLGRQVYRYTVK
ncbi:MAG TPA: carboxypeptidase-like regulatory domain-containing protein [Mucilaginibacter sp.]|nr:carboxypeptidase-like regulatory domain-containing protein [Mucilaginibacter sp.]